MHPISIFIAATFIGKDSLYLHLSRFLLWRICCSNSTADQSCLSQISRSAVGLAIASPYVSLNLLVLFTSTDFSCGIEIIVALYGSSPEPMVPMALVVKTNWHNFATITKSSPKRSLTPWHMSRETTAHRMKPSTFSKFWSKSSAVSPSPQPATKAAPRPLVTLQSRFVQFPFACKPTL